MGFDKLSPNGGVWQAAHEAENGRRQCADNGRLATQGFT
jgi:hypothetical protein